MASHHHRQSSAVLPGTTGATMHFDGKDALMAHQLHCNKQYSTDFDLLLTEYFTCCLKYGDSAQARDAHQTFIHQVESHRAILTTQGKQQTAPNTFQPVIIRNEWGKEYFKRVRHGWNAHGQELVHHALECAVNWLVMNTESADWESYELHSIRTCYCRHVGLLLQKWADRKDAKNYVNSLHAAINAPLSKVFTPFATTFDLLGYTIVATTLAPVDREWSSWRKTAMPVHLYNAICASLRFAKGMSSSLGTAGGSGGAGGGGGGGGGSSTSAAAAAQKELLDSINLDNYPRVRFAVGTDGRYYLVDARDLSARSSLVSNEISAKRCPRREILFSASGVCSTPYSPHEFILKFKLKAVVEQLVSGGYLQTTSSSGAAESAAAGVGDTPIGGGGAGGTTSTVPSISTLMHFHGISFGPYIYQLYHAIADQERVFRTSIHTTNRKETVITPHVAAKLSKYASCRSAVMSELLARVLKRLIISEWERTIGTSEYKELLREFIVAEERDAEEEDEEEEAEEDEEEESESDEDTEQSGEAAAFLSSGRRRRSSAQRQRAARASNDHIVRLQLDQAKEARKAQKEASRNFRLKGLNQPLLSSIDAILKAVFASTTTAQQQQQGHHHHHRGKKEVIFSSAIFEDLLFVVNDTYATRVLGDRPDAKFSASEEDVEPQRVISLLSNLLGVQLVVKSGRVHADPSADIFESFFELEASGTNSTALRSDPVVTSLELPVCLVAGARSKMQDFVNLQQRIASKIAGSINQSSTTAHRDLVAYQVQLARYVLLYATDVTIAHRGAIAEIDFEDVLNLKMTAGSQQVPGVLSLKLLNAIETEVILKRATMLASSDLGASLKLLVRYSERTRTLFEGPEGTAYVVAEKIGALCRVCEHFASPSLVAALEAVIQDMTLLTNPSSGSTGSPGAASPTTAHSPATKGTPNTVMAQGANLFRSEIRIVHAAHLFLYPLSLVVRHALQPDASRSLNDSMSLAVKYAGRRRDIIKEVFGETSVETGVACNDIAALCSNNRYDLQRAEAEFERAVLILSEAEPQGPTVFVAMNNLAFLYYRKAERIKKQPQLHQQESGGEDPKQLVKDWLFKAERLLDDVLAAERSMNPLDFAAALNNLASIRMFQDKLKEAETLFNRTLHVTQHLQKDKGQELPCRVHAMRNLKALAKKQYVTAVIKVQAYVKRFISNLRNRKTVRYLRAIMPIQRMARGYLARQFLARNYRFSAFYCWLRQPPQFTPKLDVTFHPLPVEARTEAWYRLMNNSCFLLQRHVRGYHSRQAVGKVHNFQRAFFQHRVPAVVGEVDRRRVWQFSSEALRWMEHYSSAALVEHLELQAKSTNYAWYVVWADVRRREATAFSFLLQEGEELHRFALTKQYKREFDEILESNKTLQTHSNEISARRSVIADAFVERHAIAQELVAFQERIAFHRNIKSLWELTYLQFLEEKMRKFIEVDHFTVVNGERFVYFAPRVGRAFLTRKLLGRVAMLLRKETFAREVITAEEKSVISFDKLRSDWMLVTLEADETNVRRSFEDNALKYLLFEEMFDPASVEVAEIPSRLLLFGEERQARQEIEHFFQRSYLVVEEVLGRQRTYAEVAEDFYENVLGESEEMSYRHIQAIEAKELQVAMRKSFLFAVAMTETKEERMRAGLTILEASDYYSEFLYRCLQEVEINPEERKQRMVMAIDLQETVEKQRQKEYVEQRQAFERREIEQGEDMDRREVAQQWGTEWTTALEHLHRDLRIDVELWHYTHAQKVDREHFTLFAEVCTLSHHHIALYDSVLRLYCTHEEVQRQLVEERKARELKDIITIPMEDHLAAIRDSHVSEATQVVTTMCHQEAQDSLFLERYGQALEELHVALTDEVYVFVSTQRLITEEQRCRASTAKEHFEKLLLILEDQYVAQHEEQIVLPMNGIRCDMIREAIEEEELLLRDDFEFRVVDDQFDLFSLQSAENHGRYMLYRSLEVSVTGLFMWNVHGHFTMRNASGAIRGLEELAAQCERTAIETASLQMIHRLQKAGRGFVARKTVATTRQRFLCATSRIQRVGRAYYRRARLSVFFAENIEHCCFYAVEIEERQEFEMLEMAERKKLANYTLFHGPRFLLFRRSSSAVGRQHSATSTPRGTPTHHSHHRDTMAEQQQSSPPRVHQQVTSRLFSAPTWKNESMFHRRNASAIPRVQSVIHPLAAEHAARVAEAEDYGGGGANGTGSSSLYARHHRQQLTRRSSSSFGPWAATSTSTFRKDGGSGAEGSTPTPPSTPPDTTADVVRRFLTPTTPLPPRPTTAIPFSERGRPNHQLGTATTAAAGRPQQFGRLSATTAAGPSKNKPRQQQSASTLSSAAAPSTLAPRRPMSARTSRSTAGTGRRP